MIEKSYERAMAGEADPSIAYQYVNGNIEILRNLSGNENAIWVRDHKYSARCAYQKGLLERMDAAGDAHTLAVHEMMQRFRDLSVKIRLCRREHSSASESSRYFVGRCAVLLDNSA
jgi:hypothetical protein